MENVAASGTPSLTCKTITRPCKNFENGRTVQNVNNGQSRRPCSAACNKTVMTVTGLHTICKAIHVAVRLASLKPAFNTFCSMRSGNHTYHDGLMQMNDDDPECWMEHYEGFSMRVCWKGILSWFIWSDEATFKLNDTCTIVRTGPPKIQA